MASQINKIKHNWHNCTLIMDGREICPETGFISIRLLNHKGRERFIVVPNNIESTTIKVYSGDMVMTYPYHKDSSCNREIDFYDGTFIIPKKNFENLNNLPNKWTLKMLEQLTK